jgi:surface antigen
MLAGTNPTNGYDPDVVWVIMKRQNGIDSVAMVHSTMGAGVVSVAAMTAGGMVVWMERHRKHN